MAEPGGIHMVSHYSRPIFVSISPGSWYIGISGLVAAILDLPHPVWSDSVCNSPIELLDLEIVGVAVEIALLSSPQAEL